MRRRHWLQQAAAWTASCGAGWMGTAAAAPGASVFDRRAADWRNGAVVYQVLVDRFAPSPQLNAKRHLYPAPKRLRAWNEEPRPGSFVESAQVWSHEIDFWGGDLQSLRGRLDHIERLGADVVYLNPIHLGYTNHKYDALDFQAVSPEFGTRADVGALAAELHRRGMKLVLDGVFNHMGRQSPRFRQALAQQRESVPWFVLGPQYPGGARTWKDVQNLPELNLEHRPVRDHLWLQRDSVVRSYLREGVDGWRLDTAYELGPKWLAELTRSAHAEKAQSLVVGEIVSPPAGWMPALDGVMNFYWRTLLLKMLRGELRVDTVGRLLEQTVQDVGLEPLLKSWLLLDNHDLPRVATEIPQEGPRRLAQVLQFTLPGSPNVYYGSEVGMTGGWDPEQRGPMRWDRVEAGHPDLDWMRSLVQMRRRLRSLRVGDFRLLASEGGLAFERSTDRMAETALVVCNPSDQPRSVTVALRNGLWMDDSGLIDALPAATPAPKVSSGFVQVELQPWGTRVWSPAVGSPASAYSVYKRLP